jgi:glycosyltransferase involved in cell wall biosynthesis
VFKQQGGLDEHDPHIRFLGRVTDDELLQLYNTASCFVFPSLYEGFGLPPLEAMACGCPVLASDIPVIREVCADAAWYFTPTDPDAIRSTIQRFLNSPASVREQLRQQGFRNITRFSWKQSAEKILALWHDYSPSSHN